MTQNANVYCPMFGNPRLADRSKGHLIGQMNILAVQMQNAGCDNAPFTL